MNPTAQLIIATLKAAVAASHHPVAEKDLTRPELACKEGGIRARLTGLAFHRLHKTHHIPITTLAEALRLNHATAHSRIKTADRLRLHHPWSKIYRSLP
jgi:hypothetical protein